MMRFTLAVLALVAALASPALAVPVVPPPNGDTYSDLSAQWFQWVYSLPSTHHPLFDNADCSVGQRGHVWFIGGKLGASSAVDRSCTIPEGTSLFLAVATSSWDNAACNGAVVQPTAFNTDQLRGFALQSLDSFLDDKGMLTVDGVAVKNLSGLHTKFRTQSPVFDYTVPSVNNVLVLIDGPCYNDLAADELTITGAVADGVYVLIKPLPIGQHTIKFGNPGGVALGNVYHITVVPAGD